MDGGSGTDASELSTERAFAALGHETRMEILRVLGASSGSMSFSELYDAVGYESTSNFTYHLDQLVDQLVEKTDGGYRLTWAGKKIQRAAVDAGTVSMDPEIGERELDLGCPLCGSPIEVHYQNQELNARCSACIGLGTNYPARGPTRGFLLSFPLPPVGLLNRSDEAVFRATLTFTFHTVTAFQSGVCPECSAAIEQSVKACDDHDYSVDVGCPSCGRYFAGAVTYACSNCSHTLTAPVPLAILPHPTVTAFYHDHGVANRFWEWESFARGFAIEEEVIETQPLRVQLTIPAHGETFRIIVDEQLSIVEAD